MQLRNYFSKHQGPITLDELRNFYRRIKPEISDSTVNWRAYELVKSFIFKRIGRGLYELGERVEYVPASTPKVKEVNDFLKERFGSSLIYCVWESLVLNEFAQHLSGYPFILVDVEREVAESAYYQLKDDFKPVFYKLKSKQLNDMLPDFNYPIIVRHLVSESPLNMVDETPTVTIEKLLVDIFCDPEFDFIRGTELTEVYLDAFYKYTVNMNRLLRYAARKGKKQEISNFINKINKETQANS
ncbi:DUF6577 family protein [Pedobacter sp. AW31-3R]|uniref:DUF6577 family protein n=1 Tax=Pedobacter sp. AW31-3R TaxID=3445781 RepID=UPI003F9F2505